MRRRSCNTRCPRSNLGLKGVRSLRPADCPGATRRTGVDHQPAVVKPTGDIKRILNSAGDQISSASPLRAGVCTCAASDHRTNHGNSSKWSPTPTTPTWSYLKPHLLRLEKGELLALLRELYGLNADNKAFLAARLLPTDWEV